MIRHRAIALTDKGRAAGDAAVKVARQDHPADAGAAHRRRVAGSHPAVAEADVSPGMSSREVNGANRQSDLRGAVPLASIKQGWSLVSDGHPNEDDDEFL